MKTKLLFLSMIICGITNAQSTQNTWTPVANFGGGVRDVAVGFSIGTKGYVGLGYDGTNNHKDFWEYDPIANTWTQLANYTGSANSRAVGFSIGTKGYVGLGYDGTNYYKDFWEYDPAANTWTAKANFGGSGRDLPAGFSIGTKGFIGLGYNGSFLSDFWEWNQTTNIWTQKASFAGVARACANGFAIGGNGYVGLGHNYNGSADVPQYDFWKYDTLSNAWSAIANYGGIARTLAACFTIGEYAFVGGGCSNASTNPTVYNDFWMYNPALNCWSPIADFGGTARGTAVGFSVSTGTYGYVGTGGNGAGTFFSDFWRYTPSSPILGIQEYTSNNSISVYPNPANSQANFSLNNPVKNAILTIYNLAGQEQVIQNFTGKQVIVEKGNLFSGTYFYQITEGNNKIAAGKIIFE